MRTKQGDDTKPVQVQIRLSDAEYKAIRLAASQDGFYVSQWIRYAIRQQLKTQEIPVE